MLRETQLQQKKKVELKLNSEIRAELELYSIFFVLVEFFFSIKISLKRAQAVELKLAPSFLKNISRFNLAPKVEPS